MEETLDEKGFVSIIGNKPYWVKLNGLKIPWLHYWNNPGWVTLRQLTQSDIWAYANFKIPEDQAQVYHDKHKEFIV